MSFQDELTQKMLADGISAFAMSRRRKISIDVKAACSMSQLRDALEEANPNEPCRGLACVGFPSRQALGGTTSCSRRCKRPLCKAMPARDIRHPDRRKPATLKGSVSFSMIAIRRVVDSMVSNRDGSRRRNIQNNQPETKFVRCPKKPPFGAWVLPPRIGGFGHFGQ